MLCLGIIQDFPSFLMVTDLYVYSYRLRTELSNTLNERDKTLPGFFTVPYQ